MILFPDEAERRRRVQTVGLWWRVLHGESQASLRKRFTFMHLVSSFLTLLKEASGRLGHNILEEIQSLTVHLPTTREEIIHWEVL
jgi:hypothetical protein